MATRKYDYLRVLQGYYSGTGWEDLVSADANDREQRRELTADLKAYRENDPRPYRVINRRTPRKEA